jgi:hypothetical protein
MLRNVTLPIPFIPAYVKRNISPIMVNLLARHLKEFLEAGTEFGAD